MELQSVSRNNLPLIKCVLQVELEAKLASCRLELQVEALFKLKFKGSKAPNTVLAWTPLSKSHGPALGAAELYCSLSIAPQAASGCRTSFFDLDNFVGMFKGGPMSRQWHAARASCATDPRPCHCHCCCCCQRLRLRLLVVVCVPVRVIRQLRQQLLRQERIARP